MIVRSCRLIRLRCEEAVLQEIPAWLIVNCRAGFGVADKTRKTPSTWELDVTFDDERDAALFATRFG